MIFFLIIAAVVISIYSIVILFAASKIIIKKKSDQHIFPKSGFTYSIIIPFRNEIENLAFIFSDLKNLNFDQARFEVRFVDDGSTDGSFELLKGYELPENFRLLKSANQGKKQAINLAISTAIGDYIYTVDADCRLHPDILKHIDKTIQFKNPGLLVLPVLSNKGDGLLSRFQYYDYLSLMGANVAAHELKGHPALASGANLVFSKAKFVSIIPFEKNLHISSGDDMFLLRAFIDKEPDNVVLNYSKESLVITKAENSWLALIKQRVRWAGKMKHFIDTTSFFLGVLSLAMQLVLLGFIILSLFYQPGFIVYFIVLWLLKSLLDCFFFKKVALLFEQKVSFFSVILLELIYMIFVPVVVLLSLFYHPKWKGRIIAG